MSSFIADILAVVSDVLIAVGALVIVIGALGLIRMPDVFTRMHAAGMIDTTGAGLVFAGLILKAGLGLIAFKLAVLMGLLFFTSPVATHALARAALYGGVTPKLDEGGEVENTTGTRSDFAPTRTRK